MKYFRTYAKELGCENVDELGDLAVWNYIRATQGKEPLTLPLVVVYERVFT